MVTCAGMCCCYLTCTCIQNGATPVYVAAQNGQVGTLRALISAGNKFNAANVVSTECVSLIIVLYYTTFGFKLGQSTEIM